MLNSLGFSELPAKGLIPFGEIDGKLQIGTPAQAKDIIYLQNYPNVVFTKDSYQSKDLIKDIFVPIEETTVKRLIQIWYESGFYQALEQAAAEESQSRLRIHPLIRITAFNIHRMTKWFNSLKESLHTPTKDFIIRPSTQIRQIAWHPSAGRLAVALWDDTVRVYSTSSNLALTLRHKEQRQVNGVSWRPLTGAELAVSCARGIVLWRLDPLSVVTRPSGSTCTTVLSCPKPTTCLAWTPGGDLLVTCSRDGPLRIWEPEQERYVERQGLGGAYQALFSPNSLSLFTGSCQRECFRIWETKTWSYEQWRGSVQAAAWSSCGKLLLFATSNEPFIYCLSSPQRAALPILDLTRYELPCGNVIGGLVMLMAWCPKSRHLAIVTQDNSELVIVMRTSVVDTSVQVAPAFLLNGLPGESVASFAFDPSNPQDALLTVAWSSGRIQHFPIINSPELRISPIPSLES